MPSDALGGASSVYLDHQASTPAEELVIEAMLPWLRALGNPHARHRCGSRARDAVEQARDQIAGLVGGRAGRIVFTSGATEATNLALRGLGLGPGSRCVTSSIKHPCVHGTPADLARSGVSTEVAVDSRRDRSRRLLRGRRRGAEVVSLMAVNNEVGTIQPFRKTASTCRAASVACHSDMTQALGRIPLDLSADEIGLASFSAHKIGGPQGVGALFVGEATTLAPVATGGGQEDGLRPGTVPAALTISFGVACELACLGMADEQRRLVGLRDRFKAALRQADVAFDLNGSLSKRIPANLNLRIDGVDGDALIDRLPDVCISTGSACHSGAVSPSHVLTAMGLGDSAASSSIRVGFGRSTTIDDVEYAARRIAGEVAELRGAVATTGKPAVIAARRRVGGSRLTRPA